MGRERSDWLGVVFCSVEILCVMLDVEDIVGLQGLIGCGKLDGVRCDWMKE